MTWLNEAKLQEIIVEADSEGLPDGNPFAQAPGLVGLRAVIVAADARVGMASSEDLPAAFAAGALWGMGLGYEYRRRTS